MSRLHVFDAGAVLAGLFAAAPLRWALGAWWCWWLPMQWGCR
jgi:hypothetical protein